MRCGCQVLRLLVDFVLSFLYTGTCYLKKLNRNLTTNLNTISTTNSRTTTTNLATNLNTISTNLTTNLNTISTTSQGASPCDLAALLGGHAGPAAVARLLVQPPKQPLRWSGLLASPTLLRVRRPRSFQCSGRASRLGWRSLLGQAWRWQALPRCPAAGPRLLGSWV